MTTAAEQRQAVIDEAKTWLRTPHHNGACIKGEKGGVDCGQFPWAVYNACGLMPPIDGSLRYSPEFHLHRNVEWYKNLADKYGKPVASPQPGDFALYKIGRIYSHGAIVIKWPEIIHAFIKIGVTLDLGNQGYLDTEKTKTLFYTLWDD